MRRLASSRFTSTSKRLSSSGGHGAPPRPLADQRERVAIDPEQLVRDVEVPARGQQVGGLRADLGAEAALAVDDLGALHLELPLGDADAPFLAAD